MMIRLRWTMICLSVVWLTPPLGADDDTRASRQAAQTLAAKIDQHIEARWKKAGVRPAPPAGDAEFLRRVSLDIIGRVPSVYETRSFLANTSPDKRQRLVDALLQRPRYVVHFTNFWRDLLLPEAKATASFQIRALAPGFENWLRQKLVTNARYDKMVYELLTAQPSAGGRGATLRLYGGNQRGPMAFYQAKENKPENLAAASSRLFLGVRLECAQCHDHPFADWSREDFWSYAAFFASMQTARVRGGGAIGFPTRSQEPLKHDIKIPGSKRVVEARYLDGKKPNWKNAKSARETLANWITAKGNPYFARAIVNRMWQHFFGRGLIEPVDAMVGEDNEASHPKLLALLAKEFAANDFDLQFLMRAITASRAYQLSSVRTHKSQDNVEMFARTQLRGLTGEQLYDSIVQATGYREANTSSRRPVFLNNNGSPRQAFLNKFGNQSTDKTDVQTSILQALTMMNGKLISTATDIRDSRTLSAVLDAPFLTTAKRIDILYLAALSREPTGRERQRMLRFVEQHADSDEALADIFWVLLNSSEFFLNH